MRREKRKIAFAYKILFTHSFILSQIMYACVYKYYKNYI